MIGLQDIVNKIQQEWETKTGYGQLTSTNHFNDEKQLRKECMGHFND